MSLFRVETIPDHDPFSSEGKSGKRIVFDILETLLLSLILFWIINSITARIQIESVSMRETLHPNDFVFVNKLAYRFNGAERGDVVVFDPPFESPEPYIKRVIGIEGDEVRIENGSVIINGTIIQESYLGSTSTTSGRWHVPDGSLFVMGDNRSNSSDSRSWGMVPIDNVIGEALFVYWPPEQWSTLSPGAIAAGEPYP